MVFRVVLISLIIGFVLALVVAFSDRLRKDKAVWVTVLLAIPLAALAVYHLLYRRDNKPGVPKDWDLK